MSKYTTIETSFIGGHPMTTYSNEEKVVVKENWKDIIESAFDEGYALHHIFNPNRGTGFLEVIWRMSLTAFDKPREVQVVIDNDNKLFMSFGTFSFVDFKNENVTGMKLPIKCWIHTHPFGSAYFSGTDMRTINTWKSVMLSAIVLGDNEHQTWMNSKPNEAIHYTYARRRRVELNKGEEE